MYRRELLGGIGASVGTPLVASPSEAFDPEAAMDEMRDRLIRLARFLAENGPKGTMNAFVELANFIAPKYRAIPDLYPYNLQETSDVKSIIQNNYNAIESIAERLDTTLDIGVPMKKIIGLLSPVSKIGGFALAIAALGNASVPLHNANSAPQNLEPTIIDQQKHVDFGFALGGFILELALFAVPFNYRIAWRGTRFLRNRYFYRVHSVLPYQSAQTVQSLLMIIFHWFQRLGLEISQTHAQHIYEESSDIIEFGVNELQNLEDGLDIDCRFSAETSMESIIWTPDKKELYRTIGNLIQDFPELSQLIDVDDYTTLDPSDS